MNIKYATEFAREFIKNHPEHKGEVLDYYSLMKDEISEGGSTDHEIELFIGSCNDLLTKDNLAKDGGGVYKGGGGVGKMYYHIIEYGQYDNIGYQGYYDTIEEAQKQVEKLSNYFPNQTFEIFADKSRKEPPITTMHNGGGVKQNSLMSMTKYYVMDANKGELVSKGFNTIEAAKVEMYKMFQETGNKFLVTKTITKGKDEYWERRENLEMFLNLNDEDIYWKWVNGELTDAMAVELIEETQGVKFDTTKKYYNGGFVGKGELVWRKLTDSKKAQFLYENFTPQITPRTQEILTGKTFQFLPKIVKMKIESKYANVEQFAKGNTIKEDYSHKVGDRITDGTGRSGDIVEVKNNGTRVVKINYANGPIKPELINVDEDDIEYWTVLYAKGNTIKSGQFDRDKNGSLYDRGSSDSWYGRGKNPHWYPEGTYHGYPITKDFLTKEEIEEYNKGYDFNESEGGRKEYAKGSTIKGGELRRFDRHANMSDETRGKILDYTNYPIIYDDMDKYERINEALEKEGFNKSRFSNYLYGLFDGYDYSNTDSFKEQMAIIKNADPEFHKKISLIYEEIKSYPEVKYAKGGGVGDENREMVLNNNKQIRHHTEELHQILKKDKAEVPAWVVSKVGRATTDLSDATHYLEGSIEKAANGMKIGTGRAGKSLMVMDYKIWDKLNIESGSQLYDDKELQKRYAKEIKMGIEKLGYDQLNEKAFDYLENWNYHALNSALTYMGYYGLERLNRTLDFNKKMMEIDRTNYGLDPNIFIGELENKDPKYFIGVENMKDMMKSLYTYNYGEVDKNDKYLLDYQEKLGKSLFDKTYNEELERLKEYEIESNSFTDSEGLTYNSLKKKMAEKGTNIDGVSKYKKGGPVKDYTGTDFSKLIDDLKVFLIKYPYIWKKDGKSYVPIEGWQFAAALMGYTTRVVSVNEIENGYMSMAEVIDQDGKVVGSGFGLVTKDEAKWANSQKYELASFSQTRAVSRALRNCISWVIKAAGYKTTPAEEMYGVGSSKMQNMPKYNAPATPKTIVQYPSMTPIKAPMTPPMTTEAPMPDAFEEMADMLRPQKSPMAKNPDFKYKDILRDLYSQAVAYSIVLISPKFMSDVEESLLVDDNDLHYTMLERAYLYLLDNNIVLKTTRYMTKLRKIVNGENFAYGGLLKELPIEIYNAIVESGHQNDIISFDIEPFNSNGDRDKTINVEGVDYYISTKINSEEIANDLNNNTSLNHNYYIADIGGNELLISNN